MILPGGYSVVELLFRPPEFAYGKVGISTLSRFQLQFMTFLHPRWKSKAEALSMLPPTWWARI
jgi:hypothetical protein